MNASAILRWVGAIVFGLSGWFIIFVNFRIVYVWIVRRKHHSWIPLVGGLLAFVGMAFCPVPEIRRFAFWPLLIDAGYCVSVLTIGGLMELSGGRTGKKKNDA